MKNINPALNKMLGNIVTLDIVSVLILFFTFRGYHNANADLKAEYNKEIEHYKQVHQEYENNLAIYNQKLETAKKFNETQMMTVQCNVNTKHINSQRVGNELSYTNTVNGQAIYGGETIELKNGKPLKLYSKVVDDEKYPDIGSSSKSVTPTLDALKSPEGYSAKLNVSVHETYGRLAGNTAIFQSTFTFKVDPNTVLPLSEIIPPEEPTNDAMLETVSFTEYLTSHSILMLLLGLIAVLWAILMFKFFSIAK